jgi:hypothetical protein
MKISPHPYVYKLTHKKTGHFYFGYRCKNKVPAEQDLGIHYFTSGKITKKNFSEYDHHIIAEFFDADDAYNFEQSLIHENRSDPLILNKQYVLAGGKRWICRAYSNKSRQKMSRSAKKHRATRTKAEKKAIYAKVSESITGDKNPRALTWRVEFEDGTHITVKSLNTWCKANGAVYGTLYGRFTRNDNRFWKGVRVFKVDL